MEWCTQEYNINYGTHNERMAKTLKGRKLSQETKEKIGKAQSKPILQLSKSGNIILRKWDSATQASNELNTNHSNIIQCCKGKYKTCGGYKWMYLQDYVNRMEKMYQLALKKAS